MLSKRLGRVWATLVVIVATLVAPSAASAGPTGDGSGWVGTWSTPGPPLASVLAADAAGTIAAGSDGDVQALDAAGGLSWRTRVDGGDVGNQPALFPDLVAVATTDRVTALDRSSGTRRWERRAAESRVAGGVLPDGGEAVLVATRHGDLLLVDAASGATRLRAKTPGRPPSGPPHVWMSGGTGVVAWSTKGSCCQIEAIDLQSGKTSWVMRITHRSSVPVVHRGLVVVATGGRRASSARITAYDIATGAARWETRVEGRFGTSLWGDAAGDDIVIANAEGSVLSLDAGRGTLHWVSDPIESSDEAHPKIAGDRVFLTPLGIGLVEIDRRSGVVVQSGPLTPEAYVHSSAGVPGRFEVLVGNGFESAVWAFEPPPDAASEPGEGPPLH